MRFKESYFVNLPAYANKVMEFAMSVLNEKLKKRVIVSTKPNIFNRSILWNWFCFVVKIVRFVCIDVNLNHLSEQFAKNLEELKTKVNPALLPKEYGGTVPLNDMIEAFKTRLRQKRDTILALDDMYIEITKDSANFGGNDDSDIDAGMVGSFRKLEVD